MKKTNTALFIETRNDTIRPLGTTAALVRTGPRTPSDEIESLQVGAQKLGGLTNAFFQVGMSEASLLGNRLIWSAVTSSVGVIIIGGIAFYSLVTITGEVANIAEMRWELSRLQRSLVFVGMNVAIVVVPLAIFIKVQLSNWSSPSSEHVKDGKEDHTAPKFSPQGPKDSSVTERISSTAEPSRFELIRQEMAGTARRMSKAFQRLLDPALWMPSPMKVAVLAGLGLLLIMWSKKRKSSAKGRDDKVALDSSKSKTSNTPGRGILGLLTFLIWREVIAPVFEKLVRSFASRITAEFRR